MVRLCEHARAQHANREDGEVAPLLDEQATKINILRALKRLAGTPDASPADAPPLPKPLEKLKATEPEDAVFIYFAGHGTAQGQRFYLLPHDLATEGKRNWARRRGFENDPRT